MDRAGLPIRPVSIRFLIPEIDQALAINGRIVDVLWQCYRTSVKINDQDVPCEFYFTDCRTSIPFTLMVPTPWDIPWDRGFPRQAPCQGYAFEPTDGVNPCPVTCTGQATPLPPAPVDEPRIDIGPGTGGGARLTGDILAVGGDDDLWWF